MSTTSLTTNAYQVAKYLPREGGTVYVVVSYQGRRRGRATTTFAAYRYEPATGWQCVNDSWTSLDAAVEEVADVHRFAPLEYPPLIRILADAIGQAEAVT
ncbi:hypothetical protein [Nonomuraea sp. NPDC050643]|uniref:hypothetical protein n=1 Tax=Nonomuraea sp. NPDC050643 TaxID=3155660 RepID=UPI0033C73D10